MFRVYLDEDGDVVFVVLWIVKLTFYKPHQNRLPIISLRHK